MSLQGSRLSLCDVAPPKARDRKEVSEMESTADARTVPARRSRSWLFALVLGAVLALGGAASVFATTESASPSPSASPGVTDDSSGTTDDSGATGDHVCDRSDDAESSDTSS